MFLAFKPNIVCCFPANIKYHANPVLVMDVHRLFVVMRDTWAYMPGDPFAPYVSVDLGVCICARYACQRVYGGG